MQSFRLLLSALAIAAPLSALAAAPHTAGDAPTHPAARQGNLYGLDFEAGFASHRDRAAVRAEAILAAPHRQSDNAQPVLDATSAVSRSAVQVQAEAAQRAHRIATGNLG